MMVDVRAKTMFSYILREAVDRIQAYLGDSSSHFRTAGLASGYHK